MANPKTAKKNKHKEKNEFWKEPKTYNRIIIGEKLKKGGKNNGI